MCSHVLVIINRKGGVAKTLTSMSFAAGLTLRGERVLMVDLDSQQNLTYAVGASVDADPDVYDAITGRCPIVETIVHTPYGDIVPGSERLANTDALTQRPEALNDALEPIRVEYDRIIVDAPPGLGIVSVNALVASDDIIVPMEADMLSVAGARALYRTIEDLRRAGYIITITGLLVTRANIRTRMTAQMVPELNRLASDLGTHLMAARIRECNAAREAQSCGRSVYDWAPKSNAAVDYTAAVDEYIRLTSKE